MYNYIVYRCLWSLDLATSSYASLMIFHRLWSSGVWLTFLIFKQTKGLITQGKPHSLHSIKLGWKPPQAISTCMFFLMYFFWLLNSRNKNHSTCKKKKTEGSRAKLDFSSGGLSPAKPTENMAGLRGWGGQNLCLLVGKAKLLLRAQTIHTASAGDTARGRILNLNYPFSWNALLTAETTAKCINNLNPT